MIASTQTNHPLANFKTPEPAPKPLEVATNRLKAAGLRITQPRIALLSALISNRVPVSIEQLHREVSSESCDLVTVYRCLAVFEGLGLVRRSFFHNGTSLYQISLDGAPRHHVVCRVCGKTEPVEFQLAEGADVPARDRGYTQVTHLVEFFGVCPDCQKKTPARGGLTVEQVQAAPQV